MTAATITDRQGKTWDLRLDGPLVKRIHEVTGVKLTDLSKDPMLTLMSDPVLLVDTVWLIVEKQANAAEVTSSEFGERAPDIDAMAAAMVECVLNFFPASRRSQLRSLICETQETHSQAMEETISQLRADREKNAKAMAKQATSQLTRSLESTAPPR